MTVKPVKSRIRNKFTERCQKQLTRHIKRTASMKLSTKLLKLFKCVCTLPLVTLLLHSLARVVWWRFTHFIILLLPPRRLCFCLGWFVSLLVSLIKIAQKDMGKFSCSVWKRRHWDEKQSVLAVVKCGISGTRYLHFAFQFSYVITRRATHLYWLLRIDFSTCTWYGQPDPVPTLTSKPFYAAVASLGGGLQYWT